ncbi:Hemopexin-like domain-containing protein [Chaetomium fimeti]|uniref:Hemopexin-like domain-containing protein n=1 Tax=Chaetomium fimeti TaxID=1854472 RepID=A0AAE0LW43_9PEZI|nr:Hemopexin-like domain-containing protein [Chaetomium fimeti]
MTRACFPVPGEPNQAYFFHGATYAKIKFTPSTNDDEVIFGPTDIAKEWKTLVQAGFSTVDAALPVPGKPDEVYFFSGTRYVRIKFVPSSPEESIVFGPANIADHWKSLIKAGFQTVDAAFPVPGHEGEAYFFSGANYAKIRFTPSSDDDVVTFGPTNTAGQWKTLNEAAFDTIDAVLPVPGKPGQAYFYSGSQYVKIEFVPSSGTEKIAYGPARLYKLWKSLAWGW